MNDAIAEMWWTLSNAERNALCALAGIDLGALVGEGFDRDLIRWTDLNAYQRERLLHAMRWTATLAETCADAIHREQRAIGRRRA